jgi:CysZ protein
MPRALALAVSQLTDPALLRVLAKSLALTLLIFVMAGAGLIWGAQFLAEAQGWGSNGGTMAALAATLAALAAAWLLFRAVAIPVIGIFADEVVAAVEAQHYPAAAASARPVGIGLSVGMALASLGRMVALNLVALPGYILLAVTGIGAIALFVAVNALLLGRDLGEMVAIRHQARATLNGWLGATRGQRFILGLIVTGLFMIPLLNLFAPVIGAAMATHLFHRRPQ